MNLDTLQGVLDHHSNVFKSSLGLVQGTTAKIHLDPTATPKFFKARPVPYALRDKVHNELDHLEKEGIIQPIIHSACAALVVPVVKRDDSVRLYCDYIKSQSTKLLSLIVIRFHVLTTCLLLFQVEEPSQSCT